MPERSSSGGVSIRPSTQPFRSMPTCTVFPIHCTSGTGSVATVFTEHPTNLWRHRAAELLLTRPITELKIITCHLGNGASITAVDKGISVDTSMGLTPLEGLIMGTRCGDIDPAIIPFVMAKGRYFHYRSGCDVKQT